jgi:outer membrane protein OmpA-like peptidoglycan-associated protein
MNAFGAGRRILLSILLCAAPALCAQELKSPPIDLVYPSLDLKYSVEDLGGGPQQLQGSGQGVSNAGSALNNASTALKSEVVDLKAAGAQVQESATEIKISLQGEILFDFDKSNIRPAAESTLAEVAKVIQSYPKARTLIEGYTDAKGSDSYNAKLSDRRAVSVKNWFAQHGLNASAMETRGWGAAKPVAPNKHPDGSDDPEGRQKNRRVEITIKK